MNTENPNYLVALGECDTNPPSPTQNQTWDKEAAIALLEAHPPQEKFNWSAVARTISIQNGNAGQVLKAFANNKGFDTTA